MNRFEILKNLIGFRYPLSKIKTLLKNLPWDSKPVIFLQRDDINNVLYKLKNGKISKKDLIEWADIIECREDIEFEERYEKEIKEIIFCIANPDLVGSEYIENIDFIHPKN